MLVEGLPGGNIRILAQKFFGDAQSGELRQGESCFVPASPTDSSLGVVVVACDDFTRVLDPTPRTEVRVVLNPPRTSFRQVVVSASVLLEDCDCGSANDIARKNLFQVCLVSPLTRVARFRQPASDLCSDEVGLDFEGSCELLPDDRTVRVAGSFRFFEDVSGTCGADDLEDESAFTIDVLADRTQSVVQRNLINNDVCPFPLNSCTDRATVNDFTIANRRAD